MPSPSQRILLLLPTPNENIHLFVAAPFRGEQGRPPITRLDAPNRGRPLGAAGEGRPVGWNVGGTARLG